MKIRYYHFSLMCLVGLGLFLATPAQAELYVAGQFGVTIPSDLTDVEGIQTLQGGTLSDLELATSPMYGAKVGYFFPNLNWLGIETEFFYANPHVTQQEVTVSVPALGLAVSGTLTGLRVRVATLAFNAIVRYPGERFQPYVGAGLGIYWARASSTSAGTGSDTSPGVNLLVGSRFFLTEQFALFAEYKYNRATFDLGNDLQIKADYTANSIVGGIGYHF